MHVLGTGVPRCLGVTRSASSPKAARALGYSLTPGLQILFGQVTCMAQAASVPVLWTLGLVPLCGACVWVWVVLRPPLLAGVLGCECVSVRAPFVPCQSWLGCAMWVFVLGRWFWLRPATPGWGVGLCPCLCVRCAHTPPLLAGVSGVFVCAWARVSAAPRHS